MSRHRLTEKQKQQRQEFVTGTVDLTFRQEAHTTQFEHLLDRLGLTEANCQENEECVSWCKAHKDSRFVPETVLHRMRIRTLYDETLAPFSLIAGTVIPEPSPLQEVEDVSEETQQAA
jgi:hypothetical protein